MTKQRKRKNPSEERLYKKLKKLSGKRVSYETEKIDYVVSKTYIPDFPLRKKDGTLMFIEYKGYLRPSDRAKMIAVKKCNPNLDIRIVFARDNYLTKRKKSRYSDWARSNGFPCSIGTVPKEWVDE